MDFQFCPAFDPGDYYPRSYLETISEGWNDGDFEILPWNLPAIEYKVVISEADKWGYLRMLASSPRNMTADAGISIFMT